MNSAIIHSNLSRSPQFLHLSDAAALLILMALPHCDDYGRMPADTDWWVINVCPGRKTIDQIDALLSEILAQKGKDGIAMLTAYTVDDADFFLVSKWFKYQTLGSNYIVRAECPHPVLGVVEPNVMGKTLRQDFGKMEDYNFCEESVQIFLDRGNERQESAKKVGKSAQIVGASAEKSDESAKHLRRNEANLPSICADSAKSAEHLRRKGPSPTSAPTPASASASVIGSFSEIGDPAVPENPQVLGEIPPEIPTKTMKLGSNEGENTTPEERQATLERLRREQAQDPPTSNGKHFGSKVGDISPEVGPK